MQTTRDLNERRLAFELLAAVRNAAERSRSLDGIHVAVEIWDDGPVYVWVKANP